MLRPDEGCARSTTLFSVQQVISDSASTWPGRCQRGCLDCRQETVITIVQVELPLMAKMADEHPVWLMALYAQPVKMLPEPRQSSPPG